MLPVFGRKAPDAFPIFSLEGDEDTVDTGVMVAALDIVSAPPL
jgi:hypothetical protein